MPPERKTRQALPHYHISVVNGWRADHDHSPDDHDADGRHNDGTFGEYDALYGPAHYYDDS